MKKCFLCVSSFFETGAFEKKRTKCAYPQQEAAPPKPGLLVRPTRRERSSKSVEARLEKNATATYASPGAIHRSACRLRAGRQTRPARRPRARRPRRSAPASARVLRLKETTQISARDLVFFLPDLQKFLKCFMGPGSETFWKIR